jgi:hypothetical protein
MSFPMPYTPGSWKPRQSKPMSIVRSKTVSVVRIEIRLSFVLWALLIAQVDKAGTHASRS